MAENELKRCPRDPIRHTWMADLPMCPYCHTSPEWRAAILRRAEEEKRAKNRKTKPLVSKKVL